MIYQAFHNEKLSALGFGCMRFPVKQDGSIDEEKAERLLDIAYENGVNYFDTAYGYHNGQSETFVGKVLKKYPRDSFYLASKFPGYDLSNMGKVQEIFEEQLKKCQVEYFDFYLFHSLTEKNIDEYLNPANGIYDYLKKQKENGRIRHIGLSVHCHDDTLRRFLDAYGDVIEFVQIQLNFLDYDFQDASSKVTLLNGRSLPIWVMEPMRGGRLIMQNEDVTNAITAVRPTENVPQIAFRFIQSICGVCVTLSGMSDEQMLRENIAVFSQPKPLTDTEFCALRTVARDILKNSIPCTWCNYCTKYCPKAIDIPKIFAHYNENALRGKTTGIDFSSVDTAKKPTDCIACHACEQVCPQHIAIPDKMKEISK